MSAPLRMSSVDAAWLGMDSPDNLMMVTAVLRLDGRIDRLRLLAVLEERLIARYPTFSMRAVPARSPLDQPVWHPDPQFRLARHVVEAGSCADDAELADLVSDLLGSALDMRHSPWQFSLVELPADPTGSGVERGVPRGRTAIVARLHHCLADGIALANVLLSLTDGSPDPEPGELPRPEPLRARLPRPREAFSWATVRLGWRVFTTGLGLLFATRDPRTRLHGDLGGQKTAAWTGQVDLMMVKRVAVALDATVNDVLLSVVSGALRRHLLGHGDRPHDLRVFVPVDLRGGEPVPATLGNRFGIVFLRLPVSVPDPVARVRAIRTRMGGVKAKAQAASTHAILAIVGSVPGWLRRLAVRLLGSKCTAIVTNVPGPVTPVFLAGARLDRLVFWVPQAGSVGLGVSILSYAGEVTVGVAGDRNLVPDPRRLTDAFEVEMQALVDAVVPVSGEVRLEEHPIDSPVAQELVAEVQQEYVRRYGGRDETPVDGQEFAEPHGTFLLALSGTEAIGSAGIRRHGDGVAELKRMYVRPEHRRRGHARRMLAEVETWARTRGYRRIILETGLEQPEAITLYTSSGYEVIENFGYHRNSQLCRSFGRDL